MCFGSYPGIGLKPLKPKQKEAVMAFLAGNDVFVSLPTGYGKAIIYAILPRMFDRIKGNIYLYMHVVNIFTGIQVLLGV